MRDTCAVISLPIPRSSFLEAMDLLLTYDIADTNGAGASRLKRIAEICEKYGQRVQLSVFQCRLSPTRLACLIGEVEDVIDRQLDSVSIYRFPGNLEKAAIHLGRHQERNLGQPWVI